MNINPINGKGDFVLSVNGEEIARTSFTNKTLDTITFDQNDFSNNSTFDSIFVPGSEV